MQRERKMRLTLLSPNKEPSTRRMALREVVCEITVHFDSKLAYIQPNMPARGKANEAHLVNPAMARLRHAELSRGFSHRLQRGPDKLLKASGPRAVTRDRSAGTHAGVPPLARLISGRFIPCLMNMI